MGSLIKKDNDQTRSLCDQGAGSGALVLPVWLQDTDGLVVSAEAVDSGLDQNKSELGVLVLSVALKVLADSDSLTSLSATYIFARIMHVYLLDQHVEVFWNFWGETCVTLSVLWTNAEALLSHLP